MGKKTEFLTQVRLRRRPVPGGKTPWCADGSRWRETCLRTGESYWWTVTWVPSKFAVKGRFLKVKNHETGVMEDGWEVMEVGEKKEFDRVAAGERDHKNQRKASDI